MKKSLFYSIITFLIVLLILINTSLWFPLRSYTIMFFYSKIHERESLLAKYNIDLKIPAGLSTKNSDWYPFVMTFNDNAGFSRYLNRNTSLTVLYNFGHFELKDGSSTYYNPDSKYFSSFYGGYLVKNNEKNSFPFGFHNDGTINLEEISLVPKYDQEELVLSSLGCPRSKMKFDVSIDNIEYDVHYADFKGWTKVDSTITTNSPIHIYKKNHTAYIQYGKPISRYSTSEDFPIITLKGRTYVKYLKDYKMSIFLYILAPSVDTVNECDQNILSKTVLDKNR